MFNDLSNNFKEFSENMSENMKNHDADDPHDADDDEHTNKNNKHNDYAIPDKEELFSHLNNLINGKIGSLAKEIAEETSKDFDLDSENLGDVNDLLKGFMKNPSKMMGLIDNINKKINNKMKDGSIKESELLEEATEIFKNMKNMPGMTNFNDILKSMNLDKFMPKGGKINPNTFQNMMEQNVKMSKMKERMRKKAENNKDYVAQNAAASAASAAYASAASTAQDAQKNAAQNAAYTKNANDLQDLTANLSSLMEEMKSNTSFIEDIIKNQGNSNATATTPRSNDEHSKRSTNNKKKAHRKKN
jgi:coenzyme F420-reducing hydrogenase alpha subunit